jgi:hypothetical protein
MLEPVSRQSVDYSQRIVLRSNFGSFATFAAMRRASSRVNRLAARATARERAMAVRRSMGKKVQKLNVLRVMALPDGDQRAVRFEGGEASAQVIQLLHGVLHRFTSAPMDAISSPPPHSISVGGTLTRWNGS